MKLRTLSLLFAAALPLLIATEMPKVVSAESMAVGTLDPPDVNQVYALSNENPDIFSGVIADEQGRVKVLVAAGADSSKVDELLGPSKANVMVITVKRSLKDLLGIQEDLKAAILLGSNPTLTGTGVDAEANRVVAYSTGPVPDSASLAATRGRPLRGTPPHPSHDLPTWSPPE